MNHRLFCVGRSFDAFSADQKKRGVVGTLLPATGSRPILRFEETVREVWSRGVLENSQERALTLGVFKK